MHLLSRLLDLFWEKAPEPPPRPHLAPFEFDPPYDELTPLAQYLRGIAEVLFLHPFRLWASGASTYLTARVSGIDLEFGSNGAMVWITGAMWPSFGDYESGIFWAPLNSYARAKLLEGSAAPTLTGNPAFDNSFLIFGKRANQLAAGLSREAQELLVAHSDMAIDVHTSHYDHSIQRFVVRPHLRANLILRLPSNRAAGAVRLGEERFTVAYGAECLDRVASLVNLLAPLEPRLPAA